MPVYSRRELRQALGTEILRDTITGRTSGSWGTQAGSFNIVDSSQADPTASGEQLYQRAHLRLLGSAGWMQDLRVASFNTGSGAYVGLQTLATTVFSGMPFEVATLIPPTEKDIVLDRVIEQQRYRQEIALWSIADGQLYSLGPEIKDLIDLRYLSDPTDSLNQGEHAMQAWRVEATGSIRQLRVNPALPASYQLVADAILAVSLGAGDLATVNLPSREAVLWGAAARCYWLLEQRAPGQNAAAYRERRQEAARRYSQLMAQVQPRGIARKIQLDRLW